MSVFTWVTQRSTNLLLLLEPEATSLVDSSLVVVDLRGPLLRELMAVMMVWAAFDRVKLGPRSFRLVGRSALLARLDNWNTTWGAGESGGGDTNTSSWSVIRFTRVRQRPIFLNQLTGFLFVHLLVSEPCVERMPASQRVRFFWWSSAYGCHPASSRLIEERWRKCETGRDTTLH